MMWEILIPTTPDREPFMVKLRHELYRQIEGCKASKSIRLREHDGPGTIGKKRNELLQWSSAFYISFFDSDDMPFPTYIKSNLAGIEQGVDACSLKGIITEDGLNPKPFVHSIRYKKWEEIGGLYVRNTNHLNVCLADIAKRMRFPETNHGEDHNYSMQLLESKLIKTEHWIEEPIYQYLYRSKK